jgi:ATP-dependent DNA helicase RecQ
VRLVVHLDLPDSIEAYFQEAGRGGRDENKAYAVLLYEQADAIEARHNLKHSYPELKIIRDIYQALGNYFQIPVGMGKDQCFDFDHSGFSDQYGFQNIIVFNALKLLEKEGYLILTEGLRQPSRVFIKAGKEELYRFQVEHEAMDSFIKTLLRSYGGILTDFTAINESEIGRRCNLNPDMVIANLRRLEKMKILDYLPRSDKPQIVFAQDRTDTRYLSLSNENYRDRLISAEERLEKMIGYAEATNKCRSQLLLAYFGETGTKRCGKCDTCIERNKISLNEMEFNSIVEVIKPMLRNRACSLEEIIAATGRLNEDKVLRAIQWLVENENISFDSQRKYRWR